MATSTLFDRLGGSDGIQALVDDIVDAHLANPAIQARYLPLSEDPKRMATAKRHLVDFITTGSGGPAVYEGRNMLEIHRGMNIGEGEYMAAIDDILGALDRHGADEQTRKDMLAIAYSLKDEIIRV
ncbi:group 1 truncated hemoglobin [Halomonas sp. NO4]|uniref:group I truncated hemoglobin n=1 Tax=Halomonas sp. NO4 TaxID=2484813 RepID=UPI0013D07E50|nr:group 1 truncated hemoglobin [Halomonas sp. NO4]